MPDETTLPPQGRTVIVRTAHIGFGHADPVYYHVAIDDDAEAIAAVRRHLQIVGDDAHRVEVGPEPLSAGDMAGRLSEYGQIEQWM